MAPRSASKILVLQLNPRPTIPGRVSHCKHCSGPLLPRGYRLKPNKTDAWHVHCYEDAFGLGDLLADNKASLACDSTRIDIEAMAYIFQWEADFLGIDPAIIDGYSAAVGRACRKRSRYEDSDDADGMEEHEAKKPCLDLSMMTNATYDGSGIDDSDTDDVKCVPSAADSIIEILEILEGESQVYDGTNQRVADLYLNIPDDVSRRFIGPAVKAKDLEVEHVDIPRFPAKLSELLNAMEKKRERTLRGPAVFMFH